MSADSDLESLHDQPGRLNNIDTKKLFLLKPIYYTLFFFLFFINETATRPSKMLSETVVLLARGLPYETEIT